MISKMDTEQKKIMKMWVLMLYESNDWMEEGDVVIVEPEAVLIKGKSLKVSVFFKSGWASWIWTSKKL